MNELYLQNVDSDVSEDYDDQDDVQVPKVDYLMNSTYVLAESTEPEPTWPARRRCLAAICRGGRRMRPAARTGTRTCGC